MNPTEPRVASAESYFLGEGPVWDPIRSALLWVDIMAGTVQVGRLLPDDTIAVDDVIRFPDTAGAVAVSPSGEYVVAGTHRLYYREPGGEIRGGSDLISGDGRRFNDGKPDPAGRFVVGTKGDSDEEQLIRVAADGSVTVLDDDLGLSNGLAWSTDGRTMYSIDTPSRRIFVRDYDPATGATGTRSVLAELAEGHPDGMTVDAEDHLWVAVWGAGCVLRLSPDGEVVGRIDVPAPHTSCVAFAGPDLEVMVITTAQENLTAGQMAAHPLSGRLFTVRPGVTGIPPLPWAGTRG